jgi:hypothetical protein
MKNCVLFLLMTATAVSAQYKLEPAGAAPSDLAPAMATVLQQPGTRILNPDGSPVCEVWVRNAAPEAEKSFEPEVAFPTIPHGALLGAIRFANAGSDRIGQPLKPGVYTLRYSMYPIDGAHQGVAPQRDFLLLTPAADDRDPAALPTYGELVKMSQSASGTPHPAVLSIAPPLDGAPVPGVVKEGEDDWMFNVKIGDKPVGIIVVGSFGKG